jgi:hypothetical protein
VDLGVNLGGRYVDLDVDERGPGEADAPQGEDGQGRPGETVMPAATWRHGSGCRTGEEAVF